MANFQRARKDIEPYDDDEKLRETNIGQRLANLRQKIYKEGQMPSVREKQSSAFIKKKIDQYVKRMDKTHGNFGNFAGRDVGKVNSRMSHLSEDLNVVVGANPRSQNNDRSEYDVETRGITPASKCESSPRRKIEISPWEE